MKTIALVGIALIVLGLAALVYQGITYTTRETVLDSGRSMPRRSETERSRFLRWQGSRPWQVVWPW